MHHRRSSLWIGVAAINGLIATILSAMGTHALPDTLSETSRSFFDTATNFHMFHTLAMLGAALYLRSSDQTLAKWSCIFYQLGIFGFSCSLYWRVFMGEGSLGPFHWTTPIGGFTLILAWLCLAIAGFRGIK